MFIKSVYEEFYRLYDFSPLLADGETISNPTVLVTEKKTGTDKSSTMVSNISVYNDTKVKYKIKAGTANKLYIITIRCETSNSQKFEGQVIMKVI